VDPPGGVRELCRLVSALASDPLDRSRPLWELWVIGGLAGGRVAVVFKLHHSIADGLSSAQLIIDLLDESERTGEGEAGSPLQVEHVPGPARRAALALPELARLLGTLPSLLGRTRRAAATGRARKKAGRPAAARAFTSPMCSWNVGLTPHRAYGFAEVALQDLRMVKDAFKCTINDVVLAVAAGAVRSYLEAHGELPDETLTAAVPVSLRRPEEKRAWGNRLSNIFPSLATDVDDPVERLRAIHASMSAAKENHDAGDPELLQDWFDFYPLQRAFQSSAVWMMHRTAKRPMYNVIVSNVRGPSAPLYSDGARLVGIHSMGPLVDDLGLNITAWSYLDRMSFGVVTCQELVTDVWDVVDRIPPALDELVTCALSLGDGDGQAP
jgi:WS/DGAT/MGAT family acyltransferase